MEEIIKELRAQLLTLENKYNDLDTRQGATAGEVNAIKELKTDLAAAIDGVKADIETRLAAGKEAPAGAVRGLTGLADIDGLCGGLNE